MISIKDEIAKILEDNIDGLNGDEILEIIEIPADPKMGDYAFPCFRLAKQFRKAPPVIAQEITEKIVDCSIFEKVENVNAYINMFISKEYLIENTLREVADKQENFGSSDLGAGKKVIVEFSSPNIAKPFHIGHIRSTVIGNSIYKIYDFLGYDTVRINHLGDYGTQFGKMIVAFRKWGNEDDVKKEPIKTLLGYYVKFHDEAEKDPSLEDEARATFTKLENGEAEETRLWEWFREESLKEFTRVYKMLGIEFDSYAGESFYSDKMAPVVKELKDKGLLVESRGAKIVDLEEFGMAPALITKSDGSTLYITRDIAAAIYRKQHYNFYKNLYIVASQQNLHFQQWIKVLELMGYDWGKDCIHIPFGLVSLEEGTMSTRHGRVVFLEEVLRKAVEKTKDIILTRGVNTDLADDVSKQVGIGAVIFQELANNRIKDYTFSWDKILNFEGETGPYVQYTHARAASILRNGENEFKEAKKDFDNVKFEYIMSEAAYMLSKLIYGFPDVVKESAERYEPSIITRYIVDVAQAFNRFYHDEHILVENVEEKKAKLLLVYAAMQTIRNGLKLLGIDAPERM